MQASFQLLCFLVERLRGVPNDLPEYDRSDATIIAEHAYRRRLPAVGCLLALCPAIKATAPSTEWVRQVSKASLRRPSR
jgi:hypothetical protein